MEYLNGQQAQNCIRSLSNNGSGNGGDGKKMRDTKFKRTTHESERKSGGKKYHWMYDEMPERPNDQQKKKEKEMGRRRRPHRPRAELQIKLISKHYFNCAACMLYGNGIVVGLVVLPLPLLRMTFYLVCKWRERHNVRKWTPTKYSVMHTQCARFCLKLSPIFLFCCPPALERRMSNAVERRHTALANEQREQTDVIPFKTICTFNIYTDSAAERHI